MAKFRRRSRRRRRKKKVGLRELRSGEEVVGDEVRCVRGQIEVFGAEVTGKVKAGRGVPVRCLSTTALVSVKRKKEDIRVPGSWRAVRGRKVLICGAQGMGKSTFCRYLLNRHKDAVVLDADPGQPLSGPPGFVSLRRRAGPLLFSNESLPVIEAYFLGDVTPRDNPAAYCSAVAALFQKARAYDSVFVNTCGWIRGLGAELLSTILPSSEFEVAVLGADSDTEWQAKHLGASTVILDNLRRHTVHYLGDDHLTGNVITPDAATRRHDRLMKYFEDSAVFDADLDAFDLAFVGGNADSPVQSRLDDALATLPSALVGLASHRRTDGFSVIDGDMIPCDGLGIVRSVDLHRRTIRIQASPNLTHCNLLLRGTLLPPPALLYDPAGSCAYLSVLVSGRPMNARSNLQRQKTTSDISR